MSCPIWENYPKKACIEQSVCVKYPTAFWKKIVAERKQRHKDRKKKARAFHFKDRPHCVHTGDWCDKKEACDILGQCIITHPRIACNQPLRDALRGPYNAGAIVRILREHDPTPFDSYYPKSNKQAK